MYRLVGAASVALALVMGGIGCVNEQFIIFSNHWDVAVDIHIGGDRVLIMAPYTQQGLPYTVADWMWPRRIDVHEHGTGRLLTSFRVSAGDLANQHWRVELR